MKLVTIPDDEGKWLLPLLEQAQANVGVQAQIATVVIDRGYLDGADWWQVHHKGLLFVIVGKSNMAVVQDAQGLAKGERAGVRERVVSPGHGKKATQERLRTALVSIPALTRSDSSGQVAETQDAHRRDDVGQPINAVVVRQWDHHLPKGGGTVSLTNGDVSDPLVLCDTSDWRSVSANGLFQEGKHPWHLLPHGMRNEIP
jgi:hypothetical protein